MRLLYDDHTRGDAIYRLWQQAFRDPEPFAAYYFAQVYPQNQVLMAMEGDDLVSMLHLNPYRFIWRQHGRTERLTLHYIVGVATADAYRRCGYMAACMRRALRELSDAEEPFAYLMPARTEYYEPFQFVSWTQERRRRYEPGRDMDRAEQAERSYSLYPERTSAYLRRIRAEAECEGGGLLWLEAGDAYGVYLPEKRTEGTVLTLTQLYDRDGRRDRLPRLLEEQVVPALYERFGRLPVEWMESRELMLRITDLPRFVRLLPYEQEDVRRIVRVRDEICPRNDGCYALTLSREGCRAERLEAGTAVRQEEEIGIGELTAYLLRKSALAEQSYLVEIV